MTIDGSIDDSKSKTKPEPKVSLGGIQQQKISAAYAISPPAAFSYKKASHTCLTFIYFSLAKFYQENEQEVKDNT